MAGFGYVKTNSFLHQLDARSKLVAMLAILVIVLVLTHPLYILAVLALVLAAWLIARLPTDFVRDFFKYFAGIAILIFALQLFFFPGTHPLFKICNPLPAIGFGGYITLEGLLFGTAMVLRLVVIMVVAPLLVMTTPLSELMLALVKLKVPYRFAFILTMAMSLLPSIQNRASLIQQAQLCRGVSNFESGHVFTRLRATAMLLVPLILGAFRDSQTLDVAMSSRAFGAPIPRTFLLESRLRSADVALILGAILLIAAGITLRFLHLGAV